MVTDVGRPLTICTSSSKKVLPVDDAREQITVTPSFSHQNSGAAGSARNSEISLLISTSPS